MKTAIVAAALLCAAFDASADVLYPAALTFEPGYASDPPSAFPVVGLPAVGDPLTIVGRVSAASAPFADLLPSGPYELTYAVDGATCVGLGYWDGPCSDGYDATFHNGVLTFYLDTTPDADFTNPATFRDGEVVLLAQVKPLVLMNDDPYEACPMEPDKPDLHAYLSFIGGTWFARVSHDGTGFVGLDLGEIDDNVPAGLQALGYTFRVDGTVDIFGPVPVMPTTWGRVKALYR